MVNYIRFNRIEHKTTFIERVRMCFDKKFALEYQIFELNNELEYAKQEHHYDRYKELIIELIAIERTRYRFKDIIDIFNNSALITDIILQVYVNNVKRNDISRSNINGIAYIKFGKTLSIGDKVVYKLQSLFSYYHYYCVLSSSLKI